MVQITLVGKEGSGKTTLVNSLCGGIPYDDTYNFFVSFRQKSTSQGTILEFFDTKEVNDRIVIDIYCKSSEFVILTYDVREARSMDYLLEIKNRIIQTYGEGNKEIILLGNTFGSTDPFYDHFQKFESKFNLKNMFLLDFLNDEQVQEIVFPLLVKRESNDLNRAIYDECCRVT